MTTGYRDKFPSFDGTNDWFCDKSGVCNKLEERAQRKAQLKQEEAAEIVSVVRKEARC